ncbi:MAG TPA: polysaccharide biosynthesis/export family protein [Terriglobia bacterium]|nr:polysaccharide biosynthesis/export family protein [Terriglobia bacterium]
MMTKGMKWIVLGLLVAALLPAAVRAQDQKAETSTSGQDAQAAQTAPAAEAQKTTVIPAGPTYVIGPGDLLDIDVWQNTELTFRGLPVRPDGKISIPLLNDVQAAGLTAMQLADSITDKLKNYVKNPQVTVVVTQVNSQRYYVLGEVVHPGVFPLLPGLTALQAVSSAGGFTQFANEKKIYILRGSQKLPFNYKMVVQGKDLDENIQLKPGDTIVIP